MRSKLANQKVRLFPERSACSVSFKFCRDVLLSATEKKNLTVFCQVMFRLVNFPAPTGPVGVSCKVIFEIHIRINFGDMIKS